MSAITFAPSCVCKPNYKELKVSIFVRVTTVALSLLAISVGVLNLYGFSYLANFGSVAGWSSISAGTLTSLFFSSIRCVKEKKENVAASASQDILDLEEIAENLTEWVQEGSPAEKRDVAKKRILSCFKKRKTVLNLCSLNLKELPPILFECRHLTELWAPRNQLTILPPQIANLTSLVRLDLRENALSHLPSEIGNLCYLEDLWCSKNRLESLPVEIGKLSCLWGLWCGENAIRSLPNEMRRLQNLQRLDLSSNSLINLPTWISRLPASCQIYLKNNSIQIENKRANLIFSNQDLIAFLKT